MLVPGVINSALDMATGSAEDAYFERMFRELGKLEPAEKKILRRQLSEALRAVRGQLKHYRGELKIATVRVKSDLKAYLAQIKVEKKRLREKFKADFEALHTQEKQAIRAAREELNSLSGTPALQSAQGRKKRLHGLQAQLDELTGQKHKRRKAYLAQQEKLQESDQAVAYDLSVAAPEALAWWEQHKHDKRFRQASPKMSRTEAVLHYLHENPEAMQNARIAEAEAKIREHEAKEAALTQKYVRLGRGRVPLGARRQRALGAGAARRRAAGGRRDSDKFSGENVPF